jgi:hypothetical protein
MYLQKLLDFINKNIPLEFEIKILLDPRIRSPAFIKRKGLEDSITDIKNIVANAKKYGTSEISQSINFIHTGEKDMFVKQLVFENGVQKKDKKCYYTKKQLLPPSYLVSNNTQYPSYKISVNKEIDQSEDIGKFDIVRFRFRYSILFDDPDLKDWRLDLTLIKETRDQSLHHLQKLRNDLFSPNVNCENFLESSLWNIVDRIELELEFMGSCANITNITKLNKLWEKVNTNEKSYKSCICQIASIIKLNIMEKFQSGYFGLKQLGSNPIELTKKTYIDEVLPNIGNFILTEKIDGMRTMLLLYPNKGYGYAINNIEHTLIDIPVLNHDMIILDTEEYKGNYYVFDIIWYDGNVSTMPFSSWRAHRLTFIKRIIDQYEFLHIKHFIELTVDTYKTQISEFHEKLSTLEYDTDGFIFISRDQNYNKTLNYKWKPIEKMTIDFVAKKCPNDLLGINPYNIVDGKTLYFLFSGIRQIDCKNLNIKKIKCYNKIFPTILRKDNYIPVQFSPSSNIYAYIYYSDEDTLDNKIIELNRVDDEWNLLRIRTDREADMKRKSYYGNYYKYAELIWMNYQNPLRLGDLSNISSGYFQKDDNKDYTYIRKFNNFVKDQLLQLYTQNDKIDWIIDLASGKGQDLLKYLDKKINNILMIDNDIMALMEVINRKYKYMKPSNIYIKQMDLNNSSKKNLEQIKQSAFGIPYDGVPLIVCNLALHYFAYNKRKMQNIITLIGGLLESGGIFIFTTFNGRKIFDLLNNALGIYEKHHGDKLIYSIKRLYNDTEFTGINQQIEVLLPFSNGQYYKEYLVNTDLFAEELLKKKITLNIEDSFSVYLDKFKDSKPHFHNKLLENDVEFISLYSFYICNKAHKKR